MSVHHRKLKKIEFELDEENYECQISEWELDPDDTDGDRIHTFCEGGEDVEEDEAEPTLSITFYADWREDGISRYLWKNRGKNADVKITHHPDRDEEKVEFKGEVRIKAPPVGGEARETETQEVEMMVLNLKFDDEDDDEES